MKIAFAALAVLCASCARLEIRVANTSGAALSKVELRACEQSFPLESLESGATQLRVLKLKSECDINLNFSDAKGLLYYTSAPMKVGPKDSGFVLLSVTAKGTLEAFDGRKK